MLTSLLKWYTIRLLGWLFEEYCCWDDCRLQSSCKSTEPASDTASVDSTAQGKSAVRWKYGVRRLSGPWSNCYNVLEMAEVVCNSLCRFLEMLIFCRVYPVTRWKARRRPSRLIRLLQRPTRKLCSMPKCNPGNGLNSDFLRMKDAVNGSVIVNSPGTYQSLVHVLVRIGEQTFTSLHAILVGRGPAILTRVL